MAMIETRGDDIDTEYSLPEPQGNVEEKKIPVPGRSAKVALLRTNGLMHGVRSRLPHAQLDTQTPLITSTGLKSYWLAKILALYIHIKYIVHSAYSPIHSIYLKCGERDSVNPSFSIKKKNKSYLSRATPQSNIHTHLHYVHIGFISASYSLFLSFITHIQ